MDYFLAVAALIICISSIVLGIAGVKRTIKSRCNKLKYSSLSLQITSMLLAVVMVLLGAYYFYSIDYIVMTYILLNSLFLLIVQTFAIIPRTDL